MYLLHAQYGARHGGYRFIYIMVLAFKELTSLPYRIYLCFEFLKGKGCVILISGSPGHV